LILQIFPGPSGAAPISGTILVDEGNGQVVAADATGMIAPATVILAPRIRAAASMRQFDSYAELVSAQDPWWDSHARAFVANTSFSGGAPGGSLQIDAAIDFYSSEGQQQSTIMTSTNELPGPVATSPNGQWIAYEVDQTSQRFDHIAITPTNGCCQARMLVGFGRPTWSPDSTELAYQCAGKTALNICIYDTTTRQRQVISEPAMQDVLDPAWEPNGKMLAVVADYGPGENDQVVIIDTSSGSFQPITDNAMHKSFPQWSPSGGQVAFVGAEGIWIVDLQNKRERLFLRGANYSAIQWISGSVTGFGAG
jgi:dipeptidyl aminopeptidase/acylaminoacyl peptidase